MSFLHTIVRSLKKMLWAVIVAYMLGIHNVYKEVEENPKDVVYHVEDIEAQEDDEPK